MGACDEQRLTAAHNDCEMELLAPSDERGCKIQLSISYNTGDFSAILAVEYARPTVDVKRQNTETAVYSPQSK